LKFYIGCTILSVSMILLSCSEEVIELEWTQGNGYKWAPLQVDQSGTPGFELLSSSHTGITLNNYVSDDLVADNRVYLNGSGVAAGDINGNGFVDLYFARLDGPNKMYQNQGGFRFEDITDQAGVAHEGYYSTGTVIADVNGNGHLDLLVGSVEQGIALYMNDGQGRFTRKTDSGLGEENKGVMSMALADINGNSHLDLYVVNYKEKSIRDIVEFRELTRENMVRGDSLIPPFNEHFTLIDRGDLPSEPQELGEFDALYFNNGDGTFSKAEDHENYFLAEDGSPKGLSEDWGLAARFQDLNDNGYPDLYVCNDFWTPDRVWINQGDGTFKAIDMLAIRNTSYSSMAVDFSDINRNGLTDLFVVEMLSQDHQKRMVQLDPEYPVPLRTGEYKNRPLYNRNSLYLNRGDNTYAEISYYSGLEASEWSWTNRFIDVTLNGYEDVLVSTGFKFDYQNMDASRVWLERMQQGGEIARQSVLDFPLLKQRNQAFRNNGDMTFSNVSEEWGFDVDDITFGLVTADLNNNGLLDIVLSRMDDEAVIYRNNAPGARIAVQLVGETPNTRAIGSKLVLKGGPVDQQSKQIVSGGDYLSGSDTLVMFAADEGNTTHELTITWPDGSQSRMDSLHANRIYRIYQFEMDKVEMEDSDQENKIINPMFRDESDMLNHIHHEDSFSDFSVQPLLPIRLSQLGPGMMWYDLTNNGMDDLLIGSGKGGNLEIFENQSNGRLEALRMDSPMPREAPGDQTTIVGWSDGKVNHVVVGHSNYEQGYAEAPSALHYTLKNGRVTSVDAIPGILSTTGPIAAADYTGNGHVDLFVGGRFLPGQYPRDATSRLFRNENGKMVLDSLNAETFENLGLVTSALFVDYNRNGKQDLLIATEWGNIRLFENNDGIYTERTESLGLEQYHGWWQGIATGDFTGNGYPDIVATNWGTNSPYQIESPDKPLKMFYEDLTWNGRVDIIEAYFNEELNDYVPRRQLGEYDDSIFRIIPHIQSHEQYASTTVEGFIRQNIEELPSKKINTLEHMVFLNEEGRGFSAKPLPPKAQFSAGFYVGVADFDNDGREDIFISQNFFAVAMPQTKPRLDAGRSLLLKGDGQGNFDPVPGHHSGLKVYGEQRGAALGDFTGDGRVDLAISQNGAETRLFVNQTENRGLRIQLKGPSGNTSGIGSGVRLVYEDGREGPLRTIQAGSGYWSQNSATQVLGMSEIPAKIRVYWFDGTAQDVEVQEDKMDYLVQYKE
jgi:enediyne biosynthesis protein E4